MRTIRFFLSFFILFQFSLLAQAQNFTYKNWVWAYPNCEKPVFAKSWRDSLEGKLTIYVLDENGKIYIIPVDSINSQTKYGGGSFYFKSNRQDYQEIYTFFTNNKAQLRERSIDGKLDVVNGVSISDNKPTDLITACAPNSYASTLLVNQINSLASAANTKPSNNENNNIGNFIAANCKVYESAKFRCANAPDVNYCIRQVAPGLDLSASYLSNCALNQSKQIQDAYQTFSNTMTEGAARTQKYKEDYKDKIIIIDGKMVADKDGCIDDYAVMGRTPIYIQLNPTDPMVIKYKNLLKNPTCKK